MNSASTPGIRFLIPYFGKWPFWMPFFLESCRRNPGIDWLFFSDCGLPNNIPPNVKIQAISFQDYCDLISRRLDIRFMPDNPYKLCDIKPAYGFLHESDLVGYDFWAFGDIDVIYGQLRDYFTDEHLTRYDLISCHARRISGHLTLIRNTPRMNTLFERIPDWKNRFCGCHQGLDEGAFTRLFLWRKNFPKPLFRLVGLFNPLRRASDFTEAYSTPGAGVKWTDGSRNFPEYWFWRKGHLTTDRDGKREFPYLHFLHWKNHAWKSPDLSSQLLGKLARQPGWRIGANGFDALVGENVKTAPVRQMEPAP
jgi:hypothetical protein